MLFAGAYAACYHGALFNAAKKLNVSAEGSTVRAKVSLREDAQGGYSLAVELHALLPKADPTDAKHVMEAALETCPYSKALRGDAVVSLVVYPVAGALGGGRGTSMVDGRKSMAPEAREARAQAARAVDG